MANYDFDVIVHDDVSSAIHPLVAERGGMAGAEHQVVLLAEGLAARGHRVLVRSRLGRLGATARAAVYEDASSPGEIGARALLIHAYSSIPAGVRADRTLVLSKDMPGGGFHDHFSPHLESGEWTHVAPSEWASGYYGHVYPKWKRRVVLPYMVPDAIYDRPKGNECELRHYRSPRRFFYASAAIKGLSRTLDVWNELADRLDHGAELHVCLPGYDEPSAADRESFGYRGVTFRGSLTPAQLVEELSTASGLFYVNTFRETFCMTAVTGEVLGCRTHVLCEGGGFGALEETLRSGLVTDRREQFDRLFEHGLDLRSPTDLTWRPRNFRVSAVLPRWEEALLGAGVSASALAFPEFEFFGPYDADTREAP